MAAVRGMRRVATVRRVAPVSRIDVPAVDVVRPFKRQRRPRSAGSGIGLPWLKRHHRVGLRPNRQRCRCRCRPRHDVAEKHFPVFRHATAATGLTVRRQVSPAERKKPQQPGLSAQVSQSGANSFFQSEILFRAKTWRRRSRWQRGTL